MLGNPLLIVFGMMFISFTAVTETLEQNCRVRLYFGLSLPDGGGVSLKQWQAFQ